MGIREKLLDFKRRLQDRKMYSIVIVIIAVISIWGINQYRHSASLKQELNNNYNRAFYDLLGYVNNVEVLLVKALIASTPEKTAGTLQEAWRQANMAQTNLGQLPVSQHILAKTSKFLTQVGDLAYSLNNTTMAGNTITEKDYQTVEKLYGYSIELGKSLDDLQQQLSFKRIKWDELTRRGASIFRKTSADMPSQQFENIDKTFQEYPTLIYDGPFSDHLTTLEPKGITGNMLNADQGREKVTEFLGKDRVASLELTGQNDDGPIKTFTYTAAFKDNPEEQKAIVDITQKGGHVYWMLYNRPVPEKKITVDHAKELGRKFLEEKGFKNMADTYYTQEDNTAVINYAYKQDNVIIYPDLIKVKIALDNGEVLGIEAKGYLYSHRERSIPSPGITADEAKSKINERIEILSSGLAIIPTNFKTELFTYEFKGKMYGRDFLIYINAKTGKEENILLIIDTPNGILTM